MVHNTAQNIADNLPASRQASLLRYVFEYMCKFYVYLHIASLLDFYKNGTGILPVDDAPNLQKFRFL